MKNNVMIMVLGALMACLIPAVCFAQTAQEWQSTSTMQGSGSAYSPQVTAVGAVSASEMSSTATYSPSKAPSRPRRSDEWGTNQEGGNPDEGSPIGDALVPLMVMAVAMAGVVYLRRRRAMKVTRK